MEEYVDIFNFIKSQGGVVKLKKLKEIFNQVTDLEDVLEANKSWFWISKITKSDWEVKAKINVELCAFYSKGLCIYKNCSALHICKSFLLSRKSCEKPCKYGLSHNTKDFHNKSVLDKLKLGNCGTGLLRSSFPRLCDSFQDSGKCGMFFCGYLHLCIFYVQRNCQKECQFAARIGLSKQEVHGLTSRHNMKVFSTFGLFQGKRDVFLTKILFHSESQDDNQNETGSEESEGDFDHNVESEEQKPNIRLCLAYLYRKCKEGNHCSRLHLCKEYLIDPNKCPNDPCKRGFSHDPYDKNNLKIIKSNWKDLSDERNILNALREYFPRVCRSYEVKFCRIENCKRLHICRYFLFDACQNNNCMLSHNFNDDHNFKVFESHNMTSLLNRKKECTVSNLLVSRVYKPKKVGERFIGGDESKTKKILQSNLLSEVSSSNELEEIKYSGEKGCKQTVMLCNLYLDSKCNQGNNCKKLHICKEFLISFNKCPGVVCQLGLSHDPFDESNVKITRSKWSKDSASKVIHELRESFPRLCKKYETSECDGKFCKKLHVCGDSLFSLCEKVDCSLSHDIAGNHNIKVFRNYNLYGLLKKGQSVLLSNILISKKFGKPEDIERRPNTNLLKSTPSSSRNSVNTCSIFSDNNIKPVTNNFLPEELKTRQSSSGKTNELYFGSDLPSLRDKLVKIGTDEIRKNNLKKIPSVELLVNNESLATVIPSSSTSVSNKLKDSELMTSSKDRYLDFHTTNVCDFNINDIKFNQKTAITKPSIEDVSLYILSNFVEGYCLLNSNGLHSLFPKESKEDILKWFEMKQSYFRISQCKDNSKRVYPCFVDVEPCTSYWSKGAAARCMKKKCGKFHICKQLISGEIHNSNSCAQNHSFAEKTVRHLVKCNKLESYTDEQLLVLLQNRFPFVCSKYQTCSCTEGEKYCSMLHICQGFVTKTCTKVEDICGFSHQTSLTSNQAERIADEFHIPLASLQNVVLVKSTKQIAGVTKFKGNLLSSLKYFREKKCF